MTHRRLGLAALCFALALTGAARADELADIKAAGVINIGIFEDLPPFSSAASDMTLQGYDIDMANGVAKALGVKLKLVPIVGATRIAALQAKKVNMLLSVGYSKERAKVIDFTESYAPYYVAVLGPKALTVTGAADLSKKSVGVNRGTLDDTMITDAAPKDADIRRFDSYNGVISAFLAGQVQTIVVGNDVGAAVLARKPASEPEQKFILLSSPNHMGINKNEPALKAALDEAVAAMLKDGSLNAISVKWLQKPLDPKDLVEPSAG